MATIALTRPIPPHSASSDLGASITPPRTRRSASPSSLVSSQHRASAFPNKFIPLCPTGPSSGPASPKHAHGGDQQSSLLYPPDTFARLSTDGLTVFEIDANQVAQAVDFAARQPLPPPTQVFPWLHGLHPDNDVQQTFFLGPNDSFEQIPSCLRGVALLKADGHPDAGRLKGSITAEDIMSPGVSASFTDPDPREGFSVRNFQIQPVKLALMSDIIVYSENIGEARKLAWSVATAQLRYREELALTGVTLPTYNTFVCTSPLEEFHTHHPNLVCTGADGRLSGKVLDLVQQEKQEMLAMTEASEISLNVYMGPSPPRGSPAEADFQILIECSDSGRLNPNALQFIAESMNDFVGQSFIKFPSSGSILPPTWSHEEADSILESCYWLYRIACGSTSASTETSRSIGPGDGPLQDQDMRGTRQECPPRKILLHCADGYTETSLLGIAYFSYSTGRTLPEAWVQLHTIKRRNFFAHPTDVALLKAIAPRLIAESPVGPCRSLHDITNTIKEEPRWLAGLDGSFPSRILDYLYLGNLGHANNPTLLRELGIKQILSIGESVTWREADWDDWDAGDICIVENVQDNGIDPLTDEFPRCLEFIDRGRRNGTATLVHCRVGVSRSATVCIAEVMQALRLSFPRAYCFVRARRLNVIIQPHLRFAYELLRWEQRLLESGRLAGSTKRELEWGELSRQIALMNRPYTRS